VAGVTKKAVLAAVSGYVGGGREGDVLAAVRATPAAEVREVAAYCEEEYGSAHPENVVYQIAASRGIYW
jgi:hypothetical protein